MTSGYEKWHRRSTLFRWHRIYRSCRIGFVAPGVYVCARAPMSAEP